MHPKNDITYIPFVSQQFIITIKEKFKCCNIILKFSTFVNKFFWIFYKFWV